MSKHNSLVFKVTAPLALLGAMAMAQACVSSGSGDGDGAGGAGTAAGGTDGATGGGSSTSPTGAGGSTGAGTGATTGGSTSSGTGADGAVACLPVTAQVITDFTYSATNPDTGEPNPTTQVTFGDFTTAFSGGTTYYPNGTTSAFKSDVTANNWHLTGQVTDYTGLGMFWSVPSGACTKIDASAYAGLEFTISGTLPTGRSLSIEVLTAGNQITSDWMTTNVPTTTTAPNFGRCTPGGTGANAQYDGTCAGGRKVIPLTATPTVVSIPWADLTGGKPLAAVNPAEIVGIYWFFTWNGAADVAYDVDVTIDDLMFMAK